MKFPIRSGGIVLFFFINLSLVCNINAFEDGKGGYPCFNSIDEFIQMMESPFRHRWQMPEKVIGNLDIKNGDTVADIMAVTGYFTSLISKKAGVNGRVYALNIEKGMIDYLEERAKKEGLDNIKSVYSKRDEISLPKSSVDLIFSCNTYHYLENRDNYLKSLKGALKDNGRLAIIDFREERTPVGPAVDARIPRRKMVEEAVKAGFKIEAEYDFLPYQYFIVFSKE